MRRAKRDRRGPFPHGTPAAHVTGAPSALEQLYRSEFGFGAEVAARLFLICCGGLAVYFYAGWWIGPVWSLAYLLSSGFAFLAMRRRPVPERAIDRAFGYAAYITATLVYASLPAGLMTTDDVMLAFCGGMGVITLGVFSLWREDPPAVLLVFDVGVGVAAALLALATFLPLVDGMMPKALMVLSAVVAAGYYGMALVTTRRTRFRLKAAAKRGVEAQKMEAIGRLSGGIAHDFNNILTVLQGNLELYDEVSDIEERRRLVTDAHTAATRASALVAQLLAFARRAPLAPSEIDAGAVIADLRSMTARLLPATITVFAALPAQPLTLKADPDLLQSALLNLVLNARDALQGQGEITISAVETTSSPVRPLADLPLGSYVRFSVTDTGPGMSPEVAARALEPFYSTKPLGAGSGLGLPSAKGFAEQSGGALTIDTGPGGTSVSLILPLAHERPS